MADYRTVTGGVVRTSDRTFIPEDSRNADWRAYLAWLAVPNTPDSDSPVADVRLEAKSLLEREMEEQRRRLFTARTPLAALQYYLRFKQAVDVEGDGTPTQAEYPLLHAEVGHNGADIAAVGTNVRAEVGDLESALGDLEGYRQDQIAAIDAAADSAAVRTIIEGWTWPRVSRQKPVGVEVEIMAPVLTEAANPGPVEIVLDAPAPTAGDA